jgi:hypothetical protein
MALAQKDMIACPNAMVMRRLAPSMVVAMMTVIAMVMSMLAMAVGMAMIVGVALYGVVVCHRTTLARCRCKIARLMHPKVAAGPLQQQERLKATAEGFEWDEATCLSVNPISRRCNLTKTKEMLVYRGYGGEKANFSCFSSDAVAEIARLKRKR